MYCNNQKRIREMAENACDYVSLIHADEEKNYKEVIDIIENALV